MVQILASSWEARSEWLRICSLSFCFLLFPPYSHGHRLGRRMRPWKIGGGGATAMPNPSARQRQSGEGGQGLRLHWTLKIAVPGKRLVCLTVNMPVWHLYIVYLVRLLK